MQDLKRCFKSALSSAFSFLHCTTAPLVMSSAIEKHLKGISVHKKYYYSSGDLHFKVKDTLFRVHSEFFHRESRDYRQRMAGVRHAVYDGLSDMTAIPIEDISPEDFSHFLWVFYNEDFIYTSAPASVWKVLLRLSSSSRWHFPKVHNLALIHLADLRLPIIERIALYKECSVQITHLLPLYAELCLREEPLALDESVSLGYELTTTITHVRELILRAKAGDYTLGSGTNPIIEGPTVSQEQVTKLLKSALETTAASCSVMELQKSHKCPTTHPVTCDQPRNNPKTSLKARYKRQATTNSLADAMLAESSTQAKNRSMPSSSKGKAPAVCHAPKIFKKTVAQLRIKNNGNSSVHA